MIAGRCGGGVYSKHPTGPGTAFGHILRLAGTDIFEIAHMDIKDSNKEIRSINEKIRSKIAFLNTDVFYSEAELNTLNFISDTFNLCCQRPVMSHGFK